MAFCFSGLNRLNKAACFCEICKSMYFNCTWVTMAPHFSTLAWKIPWMEEPGRLQFMGSLRVRHDWASSLSLFTFMHWRTHSSVLAWRKPGTKEPSGPPSMGSHRVRHDWSNLAAAAAAGLLFLSVSIFLTLHLSMCWLVTTFFRSWSRGPWVEDTFRLYLVRYIFVVQRAHGE